MSLSDAEKQRYRRNILVPDIGDAGQVKLKQSSVLIIGVGGLGSPVAMYLAAAGVGRIGLMDGDCVNISNLQRQIVHFTNDIGQSKVFSARKKMIEINPEITVEVYNDFLSEKNAENVISQYDFIVDATDSRTAKFLINDVCVKLHKPYSHGAILVNKGQTMTVLPDTACFRCLFDDIPDDYGEQGQFGVVPGVIGIIQATEAIKYIVGMGELLINRLLVYDASAMNFMELKVLQNPDCKTCGS